jgi:antitoxin component of MazEF toxin-antitoxin module
VLRKRTYNLADMLAQVTADNLHPELDTGPAQGNEEW